VSSAERDAWCPTCRRHGCIRRVHPDVRREREAEHYRRTHSHPFDLVHVLTYAQRDAELFWQALALVSGERYDRYR
jgi:hypothetical protein